MLFNLYHQFKPIPHSRQHNLEEHSLSYRGLMASMQTGLWTHLSKSKSTNHLPKSLELPTDPFSSTSPCYLLSAFVPNHLHKRSVGSNSREVVLLKTCHFPQKMLSQVLLIKKCCSPSFVVFIQRMETVSYLLVLWYLEESLSSSQEGVRCTVWPEICILYFIKIEFQQPVMNRWIERFPKAGPALPACCS